MTVNSKAQTECIDIVETYGGTYEINIELYDSGASEIIIPEEMFLP